MALFVLPCSTGSCISLGSSSMVWCKTAINTAPAIFIESQDFNATMEILENILESVECSVLLIARKKASPKEIWNSVSNKRVSLCT